MAKRPRWTESMPLDEAWQRWINAANTLFLNGARLNDRTEREDGEPGTYAALGRFLYGRMTERSLDAEWRAFNEQGGQR